MPTTRKGWSGRRTVEIETLLGYRGRDEMIHRDDLALTARDGEPSKTLPENRRHNVILGPEQTGNASADHGADRPRAKPRPAFARSIDGAKERRAARRRRRDPRERADAILAANAEDMRSGDARNLTPALPWTG